MPGGREEPLLHTQALLLGPVQAAVDRRTGCALLWEDSSVLALMAFLPNFQVLFSSTIQSYLGLLISLMTVKGIELAASNYQYNKST